MNYREHILKWQNIGQNISDFFLYAGFCGFVSAEKVSYFFSLSLSIYPPPFFPSRYPHKKNVRARVAQVCPLLLFHIKLNQKLQLKQKPASHYKISSLI